MPETKKVILIVIDGLTPSMFEAADTPALRFLADHGEYRRAASTFPSLTPVCLSSIATGGHPDTHHIPHLVWWNRDEERLVEYGSSFAAVRAAGLARSLRDTIVDLNAKHLARSAVTVFEALEDTGLTTAAINITCYRGRNRHLPTIPGAPAVNGPKRFFFYSLYESDRTGAPIAVRNRALGSIDAYAAYVGRWLVTRDGFDLLVYYLPDYDYASHAAGPDAAHEALRRSDAAVGALMEAAGGPDEFLERYAVIVCSDHGQSKIEQVGRLEVERRARHRVESSGDGLHRRAASDRRAVSTPNRPPASSSSAKTAGSSHGATATRTMRCSTRCPTVASARTAALANPNAGEVLVSAAPGLGVPRPGGPPPSRRRQPRLARGRRLRGADAQRRARPAALVDRRDQGVDSSALHCFPG